MLGLCTELGFHSYRSKIARTAEGTRARVRRGGGEQGHGHREDPLTAQGGAVFRPVAQGAVALLAGDLRLEKLTQR
ncbi:hypothetical protein GCM10010302_58090 [Streptomyces polychromogenes]|uniref:Uncharacterized protein n=1 Tax=Streptomyces polychromogenes TaxID=67342 RepID=A0ABN0VMK7_9ACTN